MSALAVLFVLSLSAPAAVEFEEARIGSGPYKGLARGEVGQGLRTNLFYEWSSPTWDLLTSGVVDYGGQLEFGSWGHHHHVSVPFEVMPRYMKQTNVNPTADLDLVIHPHRTMETILAYKYAWTSDPALNAASSRQFHQDHDFSMKGRITSLEDDFTMKGRFLARRRSYESTWDNLSNTMFNLETRFEKPVYPESMVFLAVGGRTYLYDLSDGTGFNKRNSWWMEGAFGFDGTIGRSARMAAWVGLQFNRYRGFDFVYQPWGEITLTEKINSTDLVSVGVRSGLTDSTFSNYMRDTSLYIHSVQVFVDSWVLYADSEFSVRNYIQNRERSDHYLVIKARLEVPWWRLMSLFLQGKAEINFSDAFGSVAEAAGNDRYASYHNLEGVIGVTSRY